MSPNEYQTICDKILQSTMQYINPATMRGHRIDKSKITGSPIYAAAVADSAPITLVYTPAGSGKSHLIADRVAALQDSGVIPQEIVVLNMNIAKVKQMSAQMPGVNVMTFSDFVHGIFSANLPCIQASDLNSILGTLWLQQPDTAAEATAVTELIRKLSVKDPQEQSVIMTMFVNSRLDFVLRMLTRIQKADHALESMVTQNMIYQFSKDPYEARAILINGVQNMPLPILCCVLQYANMYKCSLFITGSPKETIYQFNMAYGNAMNVLSAYDGKGTHIIRLTDETRMDPSILAALDMVQSARIPGSVVSMQQFPADFDKPVSDLLRTALGKSSAYLPSKLAASQKVLVTARSKSDISEIRAVIESEYRPHYPNLRIADLTTIQAPASAYGLTLAKNYAALKATYPACIAMGALFMELYNILASDEAQTDDQYAKQRARSLKDGLMPWSQAHMARFNGYDARLPLRDAIQLVIDIESEDIQAYMRRVREDPDIGIEDADVVLSTIHTAVDLRMDHVVVFMKTTSNYFDEGLYRVALSRARKTEHVVFANYKRTENTYQKYLRTHIA